MTNFRACITGGIVAALVATGAAADPKDVLHLSHLSVVPRTKDEAARIATVLAPPRQFTALEDFEENPGGAATVRAMPGADAFSQLSANMSFERELDFKLGDGLFRKLWVSAPSSTLASDGLGPLYNVRSCQGCHLKDGRGHPPEGTSEGGALFLRLSVPAAKDAPLSALETYLTELDGEIARTRPDPVLGGQLQDLAVVGQVAEGRMGLRYTEREVALSENETATLRVPHYSIENATASPDIQTSPRVAPQMIGLGLLEAIPAASILAGEDPNDADGDGISGRANIVWSVEFQRPMLGRFGWKAGMPSIREQSAGAFSGDIGISSPLFPAPWGDCTERQVACRAAPHGSDDARGTEIDAQGMDLVTFYARNLAVPARRDAADPQVLRGKQVFFQTGCNACHRAKFVTDRLEDQPEQSFQLIWPFTDMLLHDMGDDLADQRPEARATGREWRTAPLWGIGLTAQVTGRSSFLHDGRARSLLEAILWHGGEATAQRSDVVTMPAADRAALIAYLESL